MIDRHRRRRALPLALRRRRSTRPAPRWSTSTGRPTSAARAATSTPWATTSTSPGPASSRRPKVLAARARRGLDGRPHPRGPPARPVRLPAEQAVALASGSAPASATPGRAAASSCAASPAGTSCPRSRPIEGELVIDKPGKGVVLRHRPRPAAAHAAGITHLVLHRHHHRRVRAHDDARRQRPRLRVPAAHRLHRRHRLRQLRGRAEDGDDAGRRVRRRRLLGRLLAALGA